MSVESFAIALNHSRAEGRTHLVLLGIANHDGDGGAWPSVAKLARYSKQQPRGVQKALAKLEELGEIRRHIQAGGDHRIEAHRRPNRYDFLLTCPADCDRTTNHNTRRDWQEIDLTEGVSHRTPGVQEDGGGVSHRTPKPSLNQPKPRLNKEPSVGKRAQARAICGHDTAGPDTERCYLACSTEFKMRQEQNR